jgi:hypothetical protein
MEITVNCVNCQEPLWSDSIGGLKYFAQCVAEGDKVICHKCGVKNGLGSYNYELLEENVQMKDKVLEQEKEIKRLKKALQEICSECGNDVDKEELHGTNGIDLYCAKCVKRMKNYE